MKILYLAEATSPHTQKWIRHFAELGNEVHLASLTDLPLEKAAVHPFWRPTGTKLDYFANINRVRALVKHLKPDVVHALYATSYGFLGALAGFHPYVISTWGMDVYDFPTISPLHRRLLIWNLSKADVVCSTTHKMAKVTETYMKCGKKPVVTPGGVDLNVFRVITRQQNDRMTIGIIKHLEPKYGVEYLLRTFAKVWKLHLNSNLLIVGDGSLRCKLEKLTFDLNIQNQVRFIGRVPHAEVPNWLGEIDIFVNPSVDESETFGIAVLEASATELPVIASNIGGLPEVVQDNVTGFLVPPRDIDALSEKLGILMKNADLRQKMGRAGRKFVQDHYEWNHIVKIMEAVYAPLFNT